MLSPFRHQAKMILLELQRRELDTVMTITIDRPQSDLLFGCHVFQFVGAK
jgi:hypothetical protein